MDYEHAVADFSWDQIKAELGTGPGQAFNLGWLALDRWAKSDRAHHTALRYIGHDHKHSDWSFAQLAAAAARFGGVLRKLGVQPGDRVYVLLERTPELYIAVLGGLRFGAVVSALFAAFGPEPLKTRLQIGAARVLITTESLYRRRVSAIVGEVPSLKDVIVVASPASRGSLPGTHDYWTVMTEAVPEAEAAPTTPEDAALLHFTSGTTGRPKGALHVHGAAWMHYMTGRYALDLEPEDLYWCTADPGWVTGTSYGILAPLLHGVTVLVEDGDFDAERWFRILEEQKVTVWYTAPTAIRMLMKAGSEVAERHPHPALRFAASVGEPLNPEAVWWGIDTLGLPIHDNWWQTETGGIILANTIAQPIKPGSMGRPLPGVETAIVAHDGAQVTPITTPDTEGALAIRPGWPSMFRGYLNEPERYQRCFVDGWYLTGDLARRDSDGYYWFIGRADDVIKSSGNLIGPFEVESVLMEDPAVAEAGVIGLPDPVVGERVKAFVSLKSGHVADEALRARIQGHARARLGATIAPKEIAFLATLPRTRSGKIMRRLLKARELGLPEGDTSTLEDSAR